MSGTKRRGSVPAITEKATELIPVHVTPAVKQRLAELAEDDGLKLGPYCRRVLKLHVTKRDTDR